MTSSPKKITEFTGKKALLWFAGFFLVVFIVNGIMAYIAVSTWGGLETENAYRKGIHYNAELTAAAQQKASGWKISLAHHPEIPGRDRMDVNVTWPEADLPPEKVSVLISRAVTNAYDQEIILSAIGNNIFTAPVNIPLPGQWTVTILVKRPNSPPYQVTEKIMLATGN